MPGTTKDLEQSIKLVDLVEEEMLLGYTDPEQLMYRIRSDKDPDLNIRSFVTAEKYIAIVKERWERRPMFRENMLKEKEASLQRYEALYRAAGSLIRRSSSPIERLTAIRTAAVMQEKMDDIRGTKAPIKHEHNILSLERRLIEIRGARGLHASAPEQVLSGDADLDYHEGPGAAAVHIQ